MGRHGTIAGRKAAQDSKRAALFIGMPNDNITRAIKKGTGEIEGASYDELKFEGYGAGGVAIIVDCLTDNTNRTTSAVRSLFDKHGGNLGTPGCVTYMFDRKCVIILEKGDLDEDTVMDAALEAGAEDMITNEDNFQILTDPSDYPAVDDALRKAGFEIVESEVEYVPSVESTPDEKDLKKLKKLVTFLEDNDDVQNVHTNCAVDLDEVE